MKKDFDLCKFLDFVKSKYVSSSVNKLDLSDDIFILTHTHVLPSFCKMVHGFSELLSIPGDRIFIIPKPYSSIPSSVEGLKKQGVNLLSPSGYPRPGYYDEFMSDQLYSRCVEFAKAVRRGRPDSDSARVVLIDDGGLLTSTWNRVPLSRSIPTVSIQQTASGLFRRRIPNIRRENVTIINAARSAAKKYFENHIIAEGVLDKIHSLGLDFNDGKVGLVGYGAIGGAISKSLFVRNVRINVCDKNTLSYAQTFDHYKFQSIGPLVRRSDIIIGCTGADIFSNFDVYDLLKNKTLLSCSSRDIEFKSVLSSHYRDPRVSNEDPFSNIRLSNGSVVLNGGYPINFDRKIEWESDDEIALTRAIVFLGVLMSMSSSFSGHGNSVIKLHPETQMNMVEKWLDLNNKNSFDYDVSEKSMNDINWWRVNSEDEP